MKQEKIAALKWGISRMMPLKEEDPTTEKDTPEAIREKIDRPILERLARIKMWLETKEAATAAEDAGNDEEAARLYQKEAKLEAITKEEDERYRAQS